MKRKPIRINPKMRGVFTRKAKKKNMNVQQYAKYVIKKYKGKTKNKKQLKLLRQAVFAKTAKKWKKKGSYKGGKKKCKKINKSKKIDAGYYDKYRGWYDVQNCGKCFDYCRWVGDSGSGGNPKKRTVKKLKGKNKSWWSCYLANNKKTYSTNKWKKGFNYKKCTKKGISTKNKIQGNKYIF